MLHKKKMLIFSAEKQVACLDESGQVKTIPMNGAFLEMFPHRSNSNNNGGHDALFVVL